ncbi:MAG: hypothetical protein ACRBF0_18590 [Calditrichia bacterium]
MRRIFILLLSLSHMAFSQPQPTPLPLASLQRVSIELAGNYFFNPWDNYNNVLALNSREIGQNPRFESTVGSYDKVVGDAGLGLGISYVLSHGLYLKVNLTRGAVDSHFAFHPVPEPSSGTTRLSTAFSQSIQFTHHLAEIGLKYQYKLSRRFDVHLATMVSFGFANVDYELMSGRFATGPVATGDPLVVNATLKDQSVGWSMDAGVRLHIRGPFSISLNGNLRRLQFEHLHGGVTHDAQGIDFEFAAYLAETENFFSVVPSFPDRTFTPLTFSPRANSLPVMDFASGFISSDTPLPEAVIDLVALGMSIGLEISF